MYCSPAPPKGHAKGSNLALSSFRSARMSLSTLVPAAETQASASVSALLSPSKGAIALRGRTLPRHDGALFPSEDGKLVWDVLSQGCRIGQVWLDFAADEFSGVPAHRCPALRIYISPRYRGQGNGTATARACLKTLHDQHFTRALQACHIEHDTPAAAVLTTCGFLYTGCQSVAPDGRIRRHMIAFT